ncbi:MAG: hypothetical protein CMJ95_02000 [Planctomycetes bacterium]|nr:hypothetical protein [Planctomycetota bacterium]
MTSIFGHPRIILGTIAAVLVVSIMATVTMADDRPLTPRSIPKFGGTEVVQRVETMFSGIKWHGEFEQAMAQAAEQGKPLFWLQVVGKLDGGL